MYARRFQAALVVTIVMRSTGAAAMTHRATSPATARACAGVMR